MIKENTFKIIFFTIAIFFLAGFTVPAKAANISDVFFNVDANFDVGESSQVQAVLIKTAANLYFYVQKDWWEAQVPAKQSEIINNLDVLSSEFDKKIYPTLTSVFGSEWKAGVDGDSKTIILFHAMKEGVGGYFRSNDEYIKLQMPNSNEKEMLYLPISQIDNISKLKVFLAHEFVHLITFNQKDRLRGVQEDVWLNESRAEYAATILGYNGLYEGSNLQARLKNFLERPSDSLVEWKENKYDYGVINVFMHYLVDHYGINMLSDSLQSPLTSIASINAVLAKNGYQEDFSQIFTNWAIALMVNDCKVGPKYCYLSSNLANFKINPTLNFLPLSGSSSLSVTNVTKNWAGNWQKIIGGKGDLTLEFSGVKGVHFQVPYVVVDKENVSTVHFLALDENQKGKIFIKDFDKNNNALIIIPLLEDKTSGFSNSEFTYPYTFKVSISGQVQEDEAALIESLLAQIASLKQQIAALQSGEPKNPLAVSCSSITGNLYIGMTGSQKVTCLQEFLKLQGGAVYPEGLVTGNFGALTRLAVVRFQEKYASDILAPLGLSWGTGFVGSSTRQKINQLLQVM